MVPRICGRDSISVSLSPGADLITRVYCVFFRTRGGGRAFPFNFPASGDVLSGRSSAEMKMCCWGWWRGVRGGVRAVERKTCYPSRRYVIRGVNTYVLSGWTPLCLITWCHDRRPSDDPHNLALTLLQWHPIPRCENAYTSFNLSIWEN